MVTSRTGTATYLRNSAKAKRQAKAEGLTHCPMPGCARVLNYDVPRLDESAETDHIVEHRHGGTDALENLRVICRKCNRDRNGARVPVTVAAPSAFPTSRSW